MRKKPFRNLRIFLLVFIISMFGINVVFGDTILLSMAKSIRGVKIVGFRQGKLEAIDRRGSRQVIAFSDIAIIRVDGQAILNKAERLNLQGRFEESAKEYQRVINNVSSKKRWISVWAKIRLMRIFAKLGQGRRMAEMYIDLAKIIPDWVITVAPTRMEAKISEKQIKGIARMLVSARSKSESLKVREALAKFYKRLGCEQKMPVEPRKRLLRSIDENIDKMEQAGPWLEQWVEKKLKSGEIKKAYKITNRLFKTSFRRNLPVVLYCQGRILLADERYDEAGLKLMRVAIEFPSSRYTPAALYYAGKAAELGGRMKYARKIWKELINNYESSSDFRIIDFVEKAHEALRDKEYK